MSLEQIFANLAMESGEIEEHNGCPEEITVITDDTMTELEETVAEMAVEIEKAESSSNAAEKMIEVVESLESKIVLLRGMRDKGVNLHAAAAKQYVDSLTMTFECRGIPASVYAGDLAAANTSFESATRYDYSVEAEEKTEGLLSKAKAMLTKAVQGFLNWLRNMRSKLAGINKGIGQLGEKLVKRSAEIKSNAVAKRKVKINGLGTIAKNAKDLDPVTAIESTERAAKDVARLEVEIANMIGKVTTKMADGGEDDVKDRVISETSVKLFGSKTLKLGADGNFVLSGESPDTEGEVNALSGTEIRSIGDKLVNLSHVLNVSEADQTKLIKQLEVGIDMVVKKLGEGHKDKVGGIMKTFNSGLANLRSMRSHLNTYAVKVAKDAYRLGYMSANAY